MAAFFSQIGWTLCLFFAFAKVGMAQQGKHEEVVELMGVRFEFVARAETDTLAWQATQAGIAEVKRIEALISSWQDSSETSAVNRMAGVRPVRVSEELFRLIQRAQKVSGLTNGAFDLSFAAVDRIWTFDGREMLSPSAEQVKASVGLINYQNIQLDPDKQTVFLTEKGMKVGFGAIGKGYSANRAKVIMKEAGATHGLVGAGGDLLCWGEESPGTPWKIGIADPFQPDNILGTLSLEDQAVVTSGSYEKFVIIDGQRYGHIIDPRTGYPSQGLISVTVVCPDAELADALATSAYVLGEERGLDLLNQLRGVEAMMITEDNRWLYTDGWELKK